MPVPTSAAQLGPGLLVYLPEQVLGQLLSLLVGSPAVAMLYESTTSRSGGRNGGGPVGFGSGCSGAESCARAAADVQHWECTGRGGISQTVAATKATVTAACVFGQDTWELYCSAELPGAFDDPCSCALLSAATTMS